MKHTCNAADGSLQCVACARGAPPNKNPITIEAMIEKRIDPPKFGWDPSVFATKKVAVPASVGVPPSRYDADYFEHGPIAGVSGYMNYSWMPERTLRMAHHLILSLGITGKVLDFGCAKGFLVRALRILGVEAWGVDVSEYAIEHADPEVRQYLYSAWELAARPGSKNSYDNYDWMIAKDVFEHLTEDELKAQLEITREHIKRLFVAVPLGDGSKFTIPAMDLDVTHRLAKPIEWWVKAFNDGGWRVNLWAYKWPGMKENWTDHFPEGNAFFALSAPENRRAGT